MGKEIVVDLDQRDNVSPVGPVKAVDFTAVYGENVPLGNPVCEIAAFQVDFALQNVDELDILVKMQRILFDFRDPDVYRKVVRISGLFFDHGRLFLPEKFPTRLL
jgi:hypothetical protein